MGRESSSLLLESPDMMRVIWSRVMAICLLIQRTYVLLCLVPLNTGVGHCIVDGILPTLTVKFPLRRGGRLLIVGLPSRDFLLITREK